MSLTEYQQECHHVRVVETKESPPSSSPERSGILKEDAGINQNLSQNPKDISSLRGKNLSENFMQQAVAQYNVLERLVVTEEEAEELT